MASEKPFHSRMYFLCPVCKKTPHSLPGHLRKVCMSNSTEEEIQAVVLEAKKELSEFSRNGRFWKYGKIRDILDSTNPLARMIEEMQKKGLVVQNIPSEIPVPAQASTTPLPVPQSSEIGATSEPAVEPSSEESSEEYFKSTEGPRWTSSVRVEMIKKGLYKKHSIDHPLLRGFNNYLHADLGNKNSKQEVEAVSRFMYYMDPSEPNLKFVREVEKVREYYNVLMSTKLARQTVLNYWKSLKRFMRYITTSTGMRFKDPALYNDCKSFMDPLHGIHSGMSKKVSKEVTQKRYESYGKNLVPQDCLSVLDAAFKDFLTIMGKLQGPGAVTGESLTKNECLLVLYYLEAIIMLKLLQRPGVVTNMTVEEWLGRKRGEDGVSIAVKEHKTAASQVAEAPLSDEQESWFDIYFNEVRPVMLKENGSADDTEAVSLFFVSSTGRPIYNPSNDLKRLHDKYNVPSVTCGDARRAFETAAKNLNEVERNAVARLLGHTPETAEKHYRMRTPADAFLAQKVVDQLAGKTRQGLTASTSREPVLDEQTAVAILLQSWPVTLDGPPPKRTCRQQICGQHERHCYDRWRSEQLKLREQQVLEHFGRRRPSQSKMEAWIEKKGWSSNVPQASGILNKWTPFGSLDSAPDSDFVGRMIAGQGWKGLTVRDVPERGCAAVFAKRDFQKGEVICDYHGQLVSREEGLAIHASSPEIKAGHLFFYRNKQNKAMCIDAHEKNCQCHPLSVNYGRLIQHSSKIANVRPRLYVSNQRDAVLFIAIRDISADEELLYDSGSKKNSFAGKGLELDWMDF